MEQHKKTKWREVVLTGISSHSQICTAGFDWENAKTLKVDERRFAVTLSHSENGLNKSA